MLRFISLGADCQPVYQIRRLRGETTPLFFDWLLTPIRSVMPLIDSGFADAFAPERLVWSRKPREGALVPWVVTDPRYGLVARHAFASAEPDAVLRTIAVLRRCGAAFLDAVNEPGPIMFIRRWWDVDGADRAEAARELLNPLLAGPNRWLLYLDEDHVGPPFADGTCLCCHNPCGSGSDWMGDDALYERHLGAAEAFARGHSVVHATPSQNKLS
jgi:hypothetical protein